MTDEDDDHGQNNNSDIYGCKNISNDDQNGLSTINRQNGSSLDSFSMATVPGADDLPSILSPIIRPLPQHMYKSNRNIIQTRSMSCTKSTGLNKTFSNKIIPYMHVYEYFAIDCHILERLSNKL